MRAKEIAALTWAMVTDAEGRVGDVFELDPSTPPIAPLEEADLSSAQGTPAVVEEPDLPRSVHAAAPIRSW